LTKEEQKTVRKNLREYSRVFDQEDAERISTADVAVVEARRQILDEWYSWRESVEEEVEEEREIMGIPKDAVEQLLRKKTEQVAHGEEEQVIEEIVEEVLEETEEVIT
jgi:translation initiation factor 3 subunit B